jgi:sugar lactone lactonase YvrE
MLRRWIGPGLLLLLVACAAPTAAPTGSLQIDVSGLPSGQDATVAVIGPGNYGQTITESTTLDGLTSGTYELQASPITTSVVTSEYVATITPDTLHVVAGEIATTSVQYALRGGALALAINGLPAGIDADVSVMGPDSFNQDLITSTVLEVAPGEYSVTANPITDGSHTYTPTITNSPAEVSSAMGAAVEVVYTLDRGSLRVTIAGLPGGIDADVLIEGENGFSEVMSASTTLTDLTPGIYRITTLSVRTDDPIVSEVYGAGVRVVAVEVQSNTLSNARSAYALQASSGRLWTPHTGTPITTGFAAADLVDSGTPPPAATITGDSATQDGIAFDGEGNAWIANQSTDSVERYAASDLASDGSPSPSVTIGVLSNPFGLAFDASGNLFVATFGNDTIERFTPDQLLTSGSPTPSVTISDNGGSLNTPLGLAFDASGSLWVTNAFGDTIVRYGASQLTSSGSPVPEVTIGDAGGGNLDGPAGVAFDAAGHLWVTNLSASDAILKFEDPGALSGLVNPTPDVVLTSVTGPAGLVFDNSGSLWVVSFFSGDLLRFDDPGSLSGVVNPVADAVIDGAADINFASIALYPPPENLPIITP